MFDPTIFDNLKVAIENQVYDLDNIERQIEVTNRSDQLEMAVLSRKFAIEFVLVNQFNVRAEIVLSTSLKDLAAEILEDSSFEPGCFLAVRFYKEIKNVELECEKVERLLQTIWKQPEKPVQTIRFIYGNHGMYENEIEILFNRKINEDQMEDLEEFIQYVLYSLQELNAI
ncbi:hypothetical protein [Halalkalibacter akibai]|uniref:Uncharacterized protein n=1 Tax=Halalkalibacter akibai (strain ATCC 43226 / DSM 21942 / CIP 109018 / JCM 9157 / 1139) TaxID=1236973 RepID=W4QYX7_HALA3|nr:hypothetical protein [Halalkalibacter akibai]GAE37107.1 hypothetical protein JCM9157_4355 [Halalkalibacter akibai JCM 9157]